MDKTNKKPNAYGDWSVSDVKELCLHRNMKCQGCVLSTKRKVDGINLVSCRFGHPPAKWDIDAKIVLTDREINDLKSIVRLTPSAALVYRVATDPDTDMLTIFQTSGPAIKISNDLFPSIKRGQYIKISDYLE